MSLSDNCFQYHALNERDCTDWQWEHVVSAPMPAACMAMRKQRMAATYATNVHSRVRFVALLIVAPLSK